MIDKKTKDDIKGAVTKLTISYFEELKKIALTDIKSFVEIEDSVHICTIASILSTIIENNHYPTDKYLEFVCEKVKTLVSNAGIKDDIGQRTILTDINFSNYFSKEVH